MNRSKLSPIALAVMSISCTAIADANEEKKNRKN